MFKNAKQPQITQKSYYSSTESQTQLYVHKRYTVYTSQTLWVGET